MTETTTQKRTDLTRTESRRRMIRAKKVGWEGTVGDYCTEAGLTEQSHGSMVRNYLRALVESGEAANLTPKKQKNVHYKILRRKRVRQAEPAVQVTIPGAPLPLPPSQNTMLMQLIALLWEQSRASIGVAKLQALIAEAISAPPVIWRTKEWNTVFGFALTALQEHGTIRRASTMIVVDPAFFADVEQFFNAATMAPMVAAEAAARYVLTRRSRRRHFEKMLTASGPTLLDRVGGGA